MYDSRLVLLNPINLTSYYVMCIENVYQRVLPCACFMGRIAVMHIAACVVEIYDCTVTI